MFHLSPLPANIPPLPSAIQGFSALAEEDDDIRPSRMDDQPVARYSPPRPQMSSHILRSSTKPIAISSNSTSNAMTVSVPQSLDLWEAGAPRSLPRGYDVTMGSASTSPSKEHAMRPPVRQYHHSDRGLDRDPVDRRRVQLHDLLGNPVSASLPTQSHVQSTASASAMITGSSPPRSQSSTSSTRASPPASIRGLHQNPTRPPLISHASSAAIQLERERMREKEREKEREREREREREQRERERERDRRPTISSGSLRDTTNSMARRKDNIGHSGGKSRGQVYT